MSDEIVYNAKLKIWKESIADINTMKYGDLYYFTPYDSLIKLSKILEQEYDIRKRGFGCLTDKEVKSIESQILKITGRPCFESRRDLIVDKSRATQWLIENPYCVSYEDWEKWSHYICGRLNIDFKVSRVTCDFTLELTRKIIPCDLLVYIQAYKKACDLKINLDVDKDRCQAELKILKAESKCDLSLKMYRELKSCNVSFEIVKKVYDCGLKLTVDSKEVKLVTDLNEYALDCINPESLEPLSEINQSTTVNIQDILNNYQ